MTTAQRTPRTFGTIRIAWTLAAIVWLASPVRSQNNSEDPARAKPLPTESAAARKAEDAGYLPPEACRPCHPQHYEEWRGSMHAYSIEDPVFFAMNTLGQKETHGELGDFCIKCHAPVGTLMGEVTPDIKSPAGLSRAARAGISCQVCHQATRLGSGHPENANLSISSRGPMLGSLVDPLESEFHKSRFTTTLRNPDFCGACHNVTNLRGVRVEKPHVEHEASAYPERYTGCVDCHMQTYTGRATPGGPLRSHLHRHDFAGLDMALTPFPRQGFQRQEIESFLRTAARMQVDSPESAVPGEEIRFEVSVKNIGAGHNLPTGPSTERQMWIEVLVRTKSDRIIFRSGTLDAQGDLMDEHSELSPGGDPQLALFGDRFLDAEKRVVPFMWQAHELEERTIPPLEARKATYRFIWPREFASGALQLEVRLLIRAFPPHQLRKLDLPELRHEFPILSMAEFQSEIQVRDSGPKRDVLWVPEDAPTLDEALSRALPGVEISVAPGRYVLRRPIDFQGRDIVLRSRAGPEMTILSGEKLDGMPIAFFRGGETQAARIEGFTFTGGQGLALDGRRLGGALVVIDSDPCIVGNVFRGNHVASPRSAGGSAYLRNSFARFSSNRWSANTAEGRGGAVCVEGESGVLFEDDRFEENVAARGGALCTSAGSILVRVQMTRNRSFEGGAIAIESSTGPPSILEANLIFANSAREGGALWIRGGTHWLERNILAGNLGGALDLAEGARVDAPHTTLVDHRLGASITLSDDSRLSFVNSILWGNRPAALAGEIRYSLVDDPQFFGGSNAEGFPVFLDPQGRWTRCAQAGEEGCVPAVRKELNPGSAIFWRRYVPGSYRLPTKSAVVDIGDPGTIADPDGSRPDLGAIPSQQPRHLFIRGDLDADEIVTLGDAVTLAETLRSGTILPCEEAADLDDDGRILPADLYRLLHHLLSGSSLPAPYLRCGASNGLQPTPHGCHESLCELLEP